MMPDGGVVTITAIVYSADGIRFLASGMSHEAVAGRIAEYVRDRCDDVLLADAASEVHTMFELGNIDGAIATYFKRVGERWEEEHLELFTDARNGTTWLVNGGMLIDARR